MVAKIHSVHRESAKRSKLCRRTNFSARPCSCRPTFWRDPRHSPSTPRSSYKNIVARRFATPSLFLWTYGESNPDLFHAMEPFYRYTIGPSVSPILTFLEFPHNSIRRIHLHHVTVFKDLCRDFRADDARHPQFTRHDGRMRCKPARIRYDR